jgi:Tol biopolymer transport system component
VWFAVCVIRADGTERRRLTTRLKGSTPAWSPDGRRIAFTRNEDIGEYTTFSDDDVFVMDADGDNIRQLTRERDGRHAGRPTWSPTVAKSPTSMASPSPPARCRGRERQW